MRRYTTPTLTFHLTKKGEPLSDLVFDYLILTIKQGKCAVLEREIPYSEFRIEDASFHIKLTQEETALLTTEGAPIEAEVNIMIGEDRFASSIKKLNIEKNLKDEVVVV